MRKLILLAALFVAACATTTKPKIAADEIAYVVEPATFEGKPALEVHLTFVMPEGGTELALPDQWADETKYYHDIKDLHVDTPAFQLLEISGHPERRKLTGPANQPISLSYKLLPAKSRGSNLYRAVITPEAFHVVGYNLWITPTSFETKTPKLSVTWKGFPQPFAIANSFGANEAVQSFTTNFDHFKDAVYVGGDFRVSKAELDGNPIYFAVKGTWLFKDEALVRSVTRIMKVERDFWNDHDFPYFLVTLMPNEDACCTDGGTGLTNSIATFAAPDQKVDARIDWLYAHELFHTWNGSKIQRAPPEDLAYWFSEGFTNYYASLLLLRAGLMSLPEYVEDYNEKIYHYTVSHAKTTSNEQIRKEFWIDKEANRIPYLRGDIMAHRWNRQLKERGQSLDQPMRDLLKSGLLISNESWTKFMTPYLPHIADEMQKYILAGETIPPEPAALGPCVSTKTISVGKFEHGFDRNASYGTKRITGLKKDSPAYRAGLREGQELLEHDMQDPPLKPSRVKIRDARGERWISFLPIGQERFTLHAYVLDAKKFAKDPAACLAWFK